SEAHRSIVTRAQKLRAVIDEQVSGAKQRIPHIGYDHGLFREKGVYPLEQTLDRDLVFSTPAPIRHQRLRSRNPGRAAPLQPGVKESPQEILEADIFKIVIANRELFARGVDRAGEIQVR